MKAVKSFIIMDIIILLLKLLGAFLCKSYTLAMYALLDVFMLLLVTILFTKKENTKYKGIISSVLSFIFIVLSIAGIFLTVTSKIYNVSWFLILFVFVMLIAKYAVVVVNTNKSFQNRKGIIAYGSATSSEDFVLNGFVIGSMVVYKLHGIHKSLNLLKYSDKIFAILIALFIIYKGVRIIVNSFKHMEDNEEEISEEYKQEIINRDEVKKLTTIRIKSYGGLRFLHCDIEIKENQSMIDFNTFAVNLKDYLLKKADVVKVMMTNSVGKKKTKPKVRSKKEDARNSGSGNSKTNTKKKNTKKKNK